LGGRGRVATKSGWPRPSDDDSSEGEEEEERDDDDDDDDESSQRSYIPKTVWDQPKRATVFSEFRSYENEEENQSQESDSQDSDTREAMGRAHTQRMMVKHDHVYSQDGSNPHLKGGKARGSFAPNMSSADKGAMKVAHRDPMVPSMHTALMSRVIATESSTGLTIHG
jgi:hypothetical protein